MSKLRDISKFLSYVLRHEPQTIGLTLDAEGWADVDALIAGATKVGRVLDRDLIRNVVANNDKNRFAVTEDEQSIRAVQGHSAVGVSIAFTEKEPPAVLFHGTATRVLSSILTEGLTPQARHYVHLSAEARVAVSVGQRYGTVVLLEIATLPMRQQGLRFYQADNGVWLTSAVPAQFIRQREQHDAPGEGLT